MAFSPDNRRIVTGSGDGTVKVWEAGSGKVLLSLRGHSGRIRSVDLSPDGLRIVTGGEDAAVKIWEAASAQQIASWQKEEQARAESLAAQRLKQTARTERDRARRAQDPGAIKQWLVLLPIAFEGRNGARALQEERIANESQLHPRADDRSKSGQKELIWRAVQMEDYLIDFDRLAGAQAQTEWSLAYAVAYIQSETNRPSVLLKVGSDDQCKVYLNGKLIHQWVEWRPYVADQDVVAGWS